MGRALALALVLCAAGVAAPSRAQVLERASGAVRSRGRASSAPASPGRAAPIASGRSRSAAPAPQRAPVAPRRAAARTIAPPPRASRTIVGRAWGWGAPRLAPPIAPVVADAVPDPTPPAEPTARDDLAIGGGVTTAGPIGLAALPPRARAIVLGVAPDAHRVAAAVAPRDRPDTVRARVGADAQFVLPRAARVAVSGVVELPESVDLVVGYAGYGEPRAGGFDALAIGRLGVAWRFEVGERARGRIGVAGRHFQDWLGPRFGAEAQLALEVRLAREVVLTASGAAGPLGSAWALEACVAVEADLDGIRLRLGYQHLALVPFDAGQAGAELTGPIAGVSVPIP